MKLFLRFAFAAALFILVSSMMTEKSKRVIFFGDSITQMGANPGGYIIKMGEMLEQKGVAKNYELIGAGIGGNKVYDLYLRLEDDVLSKDPDIVFIWVGVNDVWHKVSSGTGTDADKFEKFYKAIIKKLQDKGVRVILVTPACIGEKTDFTNQQDGDLNKYAQIIRGLAKNYRCELVDLREDFLTYNLKNNPDNKESGILTVDRVHLNPKGNEFVAEKMFDVLVSK
ncbi:MAG TPA: GDSL-type esterase/lipase family protein [Puia sp.]|jgi:lysophospholipase L1-like esterase|nr:GDSL-type esterase/lipase family protein [Puia sp.]